MSVGYQGQSRHSSRWARSQRPTWRTFSYRKKEKVRTIAQDLLITIQHTGTPADIESLLRTTPVEDPREILRVLVHYDSEVILPVFRFAFGHPSAAVRTEAVKLAGRTDMQTLVEDINNRDSPGERPFSSSGNGPAASRDGVKKREWFAL